MKANELRIGNLVNYYMGAPMSENILTKVEWKDLKNIGSGDKNYEPIPLTPEWLERFGFEHYANEWYKKGKFWISDTGIAGITKASGEDVNIETSTEHVHQLQNLYFALTGEELTLNN